ncbi:alkene reductase [Limibaculum sp. M0105]|uniref:Alkene reductase n=1 Tax=Thermohalobaculum xanthum TaxID=2753746 RepID=A0A8J7MAX0_9RHOB|nr:alkene reductase [Thermohalobaculum xanthum]MBK0400923.1 alkene reductase [Thermohalobaculum xanthum]
MSGTDALFQPISIGAIDARNRVLMAPLTRNRAQADATPKAMAVDYYRQRASSGLIITEATQVSAMGKGYIDTPGIHEPAHVEAWRKVTDAVHAAGGKIVLQMWHVGRISHTSLLPGGAAPVAPSAIRARTQTFTQNGFEDVSEPRALGTDEIPGLVADFVRAAKNAIAAGFDGVEVHAANGYLLDQFLREGINQRTDAYGGSVENRIRLVVEVTEAVAAAIGAERVGVRVSPFSNFNDIPTEGAEETFAALYPALDRLSLAYLHVVEDGEGSPQTEAEAQALERLRPLWSGVYVANGKFDAARAADWIGRGRADAVSFGRPFIANPDLPERFQRGAALNQPDKATFYGGGAKGYTDYPTLDQQAA